MGQNRWGTGEECECEELHYRSGSPLACVGGKGGRGGGVICFVSSSYDLIMI